MLLGILSFITVFHFLDVDIINLQRFRFQVHCTRKTKFERKNRLYNWIILRQTLDSTDYDYENERNTTLRNEQYFRHVK